MIEQKVEYTTCKVYTWNPRPPKVVKRFMAKKKIINMGDLKIVNRVILYELQDQVKMFLPLSFHML